MHIRLSDSDFHFCSHWLLNISPNNINHRIWFVFSLSSTALQSPATMAAVGARLFPTVLFSRRSVEKLNSNQISTVTPRLAVSADQILTFTAESHGVVEKEKDKKVLKEKEKRWISGWNEYFEQSKELIGADGGPPRWFSPLECASQLDNSPLLLFLPGQYFSLS